MKLPKPANDHIKNSTFKLDYNHYLDLLNKGFALLAAEWDATQVINYGQSLNADKAAIADLKKLLAYVEAINEQICKAHERIQ